MALQKVLPKAIELKAFGIKMTLLTPPFAMGLPSPSPSPWLSGCEADPPPCFLHSHKLADAKTRKSLGREEFRLLHYAGDVTYSVAGQPSCSATGLPPPSRFLPRGSCCSPCGCLAFFPRFPG